ncbi:MAG: 3-hydroxybutyryl-CoA dehydrogenase; 3-hydroxyacyl-CoA dehydrogenase, partial [uncultured Rubrobacteraceae bacterium]
AHRSKPQRVAADRSDPGRRHDGPRRRRVLCGRRHDGAPDRRHTRARPRGEGEAGPSGEGPRGGRAAARGGGRAGGGGRGCGGRGRGRGRRGPRLRGRAGERRAQGGGPGRLLGRGFSRGRDRLEHLVAADGRSGTVRPGAGPVLRDALVQPARVDAGRGGDTRRGHGRGDGRTPRGLPPLHRQAAGGRGQRAGLRRQPHPERAFPGGRAVRGRRPRLAGGGGRGRAQLLRVPAAVLRAVRDRGHGRPRRLRERARGAAGRVGGEVRAAADAARPRRRGPGRNQSGRGFPGLHRRRAWTAAPGAGPPVRGAPGIARPDAARGGGEGRGM